MSNIAVSLCPLVSIVIPVYNRAEVIEETLKSVLLQSYKNLECLIVDDGSNDESISIIKEYEKRDNRIKLFHRPDNRIKGANSCRNIGIENMNGEYVKFLDSDDIISFDLIEQQVNCLTNHKNRFAVCTSQFTYFKNAIDGNAKLRFEKLSRDYNSGYELLEDFGKFNLYYPPHIYLVGRDLISKSGLWNESLLINQDGEFFTRILLNTEKVVHSSKGIAYYRYGAGLENTGTINSSIKQHHLILSWILIETHIALSCGDYNSNYTKNAKKVLINKIKDKELLIKYSRFLHGDKKVSIFFTNILLSLKTIFKLG